jgi:hypothetical protein
MQRIQIGRTGSPACPYVGATCWSPSVPNPPFSKGGVGGLRAPSSLPSRLRDNSEGRALNFSPLEGETQVRGKVPFALILSKCLHAIPAEAGIQVPNHLSPCGRDKSEGDLQMGSLEHPLQAVKGHPSRGMAVPIYPSTHTGYHHRRSVTYVIS